MTARPRNWMLYGLVDSLKPQRGYVGAGCNSREGKMVGLEEIWQGLSVWSSARKLENQYK